MNEDFKQVTEMQFWKHVGNAEQKGLPYDYLKVSGKTGFFKDGEMIGYVEQVLAHESYFISNN